MRGGRILVVKLLAGPEGAVTFLHQQPALNNITCEENTIRADFSGDDEAARVLLRELVLQQFPVAGFGLEQENLENVFMEVTRDAQPDA